MDTPISHPTAIHHLRLTVSDIHRSKQFYQHLLGAEPAFDLTDKVNEPGVREDPAQLFGGCGFALGDQLLGLRPALDSTGTFLPGSVGLDHVSLAVASVDELHAAAQRLDEAGIEHGEVKELTDLGVAIVSVQDPDDINLELSATLG